jgi:hypothetical protein
MLRQVRSASSSETWVPGRRIGLGDEERLREIVLELASTLDHQPIAGGIGLVASVA